VFVAKILKGFLGKEASIDLFNKTWHTRVYEAWRRSKIEEPIGA